MKLFEFVMLVIVNCPNKLVFVRRIMGLDEDVQMHLMHFIQKIMKNEDETNQQQEVEKKEIDALKAEKKRICDQVINLEQELTLAHDEYAVLHAEFFQVKMENERLLLDVGKRSSLETRSNKAIELDLIMRISEKDEVISELKKMIETKKKVFESEICQLRDDLDIANNKLLDASNNEKAIHQYKKKLENFVEIKKKFEELQEQNEVMSCRLSAQEREIENLFSVKKQYCVVKEQYEHEKIHAETLSFSIENKEKQLKKLEKLLEDYKERLLFLQKKVEDLEAAEFLHESSHLSEESFNQFDKENITKDRIKFLEQIESLSKDLLHHKDLLFKSKTKRAQLKETLKMRYEDFSSMLQRTFFELDAQQKFISELENNNFYLSEEIQKLSELIKAKETDLMLYNQALEDLQALKASKSQLSTQYKTLLTEKEELTSRFGDLTSELLNYKSQLISQENQLKNFELQIRSYEYKITSLQSSSPEDLDTSSSLYKRAALSTELRVSELQQRIKELTTENRKILEDSQTQIKLAKIEYEKEIQKKDEEVVRMAEEATSELMNQREQLVCQLQSERRNSIMNFQRAMSIRESPFGSNKEVFKLREVLMEKEKEIAKLVRNNKELKKCWNHTAKLLKAVWKELGKETQKIEEAVKDSAIEIV